MKKLLFGILLAGNSLMGQNFGFNGAGFFENYNSDVERYLSEMNQPFTLRVPGGAITKFHDPYNVKKGWGMTEEVVKDWFEKSGFDEDGSGLDKWLGKTREQPNHSYLDDLIALQKKFPEMRVLYVLNVLNSTPEANMQAIRYLMNNGVNVTGVEAGNEVYGKYANFQEYINDFEPVFNMLRKEFPQIKKGLVGNAAMMKPEFIKWNDALAAYKGDYDAVIMHYYYTQRELGDAYDMIPQRGVNNNGLTYNATLDKAFQKAADLLLNKKLMEDGVKYCKEKYPGKAIWVTEWNTKPSSMLNNTIVNGAWQFKSLIENRNDIEYLLIHNGASPDIYGIISRNNKLDGVGEQMVRRMGYWAFVLASETDQPVKINKGTKYTLQPDADGEMYYYFTNMEEAYDITIDMGKHKIESATINYVSGCYPYSASGIAGYMSKGTSKSYEIDSIKRREFTGNIPQYSFGYVKIKVGK